MSNGEKKLVRARDDRWFAGVCGGLGQYFGIDSTVIRVLFVLFSVFVGGGIIAYIILWIIMPEEPAAAGMGKVIAEDEPDQS
ncbi:MAG: PspC domain-containing protein [Ardenticatenaceae bacterium]|nr:PspC domain-containing protein [Anaerolineales bacterium]MCB8982211.1 PspC domain-containing protein [Ardenticatenaceae bacterium]MCB8986998.1 PspC domain-containing protein [Ardenticatenaceae bacterium]